MGFLEIIEIIWKNSGSFYHSEADETGAYYKVGISINNKLRKYDKSITP